MTTSQPENAPEVDALPILDEAHMARLLSQAAGRELLGVYLEESAAIMEQLRQALSQGEAAAAGRAAHGLKGSSAYIGAPALRGAAAQLEALGRAGALEAARAALPELEIVYARTCAALHQRLAGAAGRSQA